MVDGLGTWNINSFPSGDQSVGKLRRRAKLSFDLTAGRCFLERKFPPARSDLKMMRVPSGDQIGEVSVSAWDVNLVSTPRATSSSQMSDVLVSGSTRPMASRVPSGDSRKLTSPISVAVPSACPSRSNHVSRLNVVSHSRRR